MTVTDTNPATEPESAPPATAEALAGTPVETISEAQGAVVDEVLVEEISIDGMCGVY